MFSLEIETNARLLVDEARERSLRIVAAESCTGGLVSAAITAVSGSSDVFDRGLITYSNRAKQDLLGIAGDLIADYGAVSEPVVRMMAEGALENSNAHVSVAITGVAGPTGGTEMKPVGLVHFATCRANQSVMHRVERFDSDLGREQIQLAAVQIALEMLRDRMR
jgi:nicotinamide-nucleotide amidase